VKKSLAHPQAPAKLARGRIQPPVVAINGLVVERDAPILKSIDWRVARGEHWVILGANGSGKTSMLSTLTGYMPPTAGEIVLLGETYGRSDWRELRKRVGIISSAILNLMEGHETALSAVISGRHAMLGMWGDTGADERAEALRILRQIEASICATVPGVFYRRASASAS
jgi:iron complex transport system ATP-binding protein